jgi:hypothetical protein
MTMPDWTPEQWVIWNIADQQIRAIPREMAFKECPCIGCNLRDAPFFADWLEDHDLPADAIRRYLSEFVGIPGSETRRYDDE